MRTFLFLPLLFAAMAPAQSLLIRVQQDSSISPVVNGGSITVNALAVNRSQMLTVTITYTGTTSVSFPMAPQLRGSADFSIATPPTTTTLAPNQSLSLNLRYLPKTTQQTQAQLDFAFLEDSLQLASTPGSPTPIPVPPKPGLVVLGINGTVPDFALNYGLAADGNIVNLPADGELSFARTIINSAAPATIVLVNRGSGPGRVRSIATTGSAFSLASLPLIPPLLPAGATLQFQVLYRPRQVGTDSGTLALTFEGDTTYTVTLTGQGIASQFTYELLPPDGMTPRVISPHQVVTLPATSLGEKSLVFIRMRNSGPIDVAVDAITISGTGFSLADQPFLPLTLAPGGVQLFSVLFTPFQPGRQTGRLRVGADLFEIAGDGLGPLLSYSYLSPAGLIGVQPLGTVILPSVQVGQSATVEFTIRNNGTTPAPLVSAAIVADGRSAFLLSGLPPLPTAIAPNGSIAFTIHFSPLTSGLAGVSLRLDSEAFTLSGLGRMPESLPDYTLAGPAAVQAFEQPGLSLTLSSPYSVPLTGTLTISTESDSFASDPSVLFVSGGRVATFHIPAGSSQAVFSNGATELKFQTGSVAGTIIVTPAFAASGGLNVTPESPKQYRAVLALLPPRIAGLSIDARTSNSFTVQMLGHATTRTITKITVSLKGKPGFNFSSTELVQDLTASSFLWFNSQPAAAFGGQFVLQLPIALTTSDTSTSAVPPIQAIESITVKLTNERGTSNSVTAPL